MGRMKPKRAQRDQRRTQADGRKPAVRLGYYRPVPVGAWPFESMELRTKEFPAGAEPTCAACGTVNFRRDRSDNPETTAFEVPGPDGRLRLECGGCHPEFLDPDALPKQRTAPADPDAAEKAGALARRDHFDVHEDGSMTGGHEDCGCTDPFGLRRAMIESKGHRVPDSVSDEELKAVDLISAISKLFPGQTCAGPLIVHHSGAAECHQLGCPGVTATGHDMEITDPCSLHTDTQMTHPCARCTSPTRSA